MRGSVIGRILLVLILVALMVPAKQRAAAQAVRSCGVSLVSLSIGTGGGQNQGNPGAVLGEPDGVRGPFISLGRGGTAVLQLGGAGVSGDGTPNSDLFVYESGTLPEFVFVWVSTDGANWVSVGLTGSQASGIDLDAAGIGPGTSYTYVMVQDDPNSGSHTPGQNLTGGPISMRSAGAIRKMERRSRSTTKQRSIRTKRTSSTS